LSLMHLITGSAKIFLEAHPNKDKSALSRANL
jgi:hypothetical protein